MPCLVYSSIPGKRQILELDPTIVPITVGRNARSNIRTDNSSVSRNHGRLGIEGEGYFVKDMGSRNGTFLNGERLSGKCMVRDGDIIHFGEFPVVFLEDEAGMPLIPDEILEPGPAVPSSEKNVRKTQKVRPTREAARKARSEKHLKAPPPKAKARPQDPTEKMSRPPSLSKAPETSGKEELSGPSDVHTKRYLDRIASLTREKDELRDELKDLRRQVEQSEKEGTELNSRVQRLELELDAVSSRYQMLRDQTSRQTELVDGLRDELAGKDESLFGMEKDLEEAKRSADRLEEGRKGHEGELSEMKISLTQRDRKIEDLQRQLDLTEYDLRAAKEEIESLQDDFNREGGDLQKAERRMQHLQEIISEKESHVESMRRQIQEKDLEIRQVRMGVGIQDLEEEKRKILEDFYQKSNEVQEITEKKREQDFLINELKEQNSELSERIKKLQDRKLDIKSHPDFKALVRKYELRAQQRDHAQSELAAAREELEKFPPTDRARMEDEIRFLTRKFDATQKKLRGAKERTSPSIDLGTKWLEQVRAAFDQWKTNLVLLRTYARDLSAIDASESPELRESLDGIEQLVTLLHADGMALEEELAKIPEETPDE